MRRRFVKLLLVSPFGVPLVPLFAQEEAPQQGQDDAELKKLGTVMAFLRDRNARDYGITSPNGIDDCRYVEVGGIAQWITIRGEDRRNLAAPSPCRSS